MEAIKSRCSSVSIVTRLRAGRPASYPMRTDGPGRGIDHSSPSI